MKRFFLTRKINKRINTLCGLRDAAYTVAKTCNPYLPVEKRLSFQLAGDRLNKQVNLLIDLKNRIK